MKQQIQGHIANIPQFQHRIQVVTQELKASFDYILPPKFQERIAEAKQDLSSQTQWAESFQDVITYFIEGTVNQSLMGLCMKLKKELTKGSQSFWLSQVCDLAENEKYSENLRIWHIEQSQRSSLPILPNEDQKNRRFQKVAKADMLCSKILLYSLYELRDSYQHLQNTDSLETNQILGSILARVDSNHEKFEQSDRRLSELLKVFPELGSDFSKTKINCNNIKPLDLKRKSSSKRTKQTKLMEYSKETINVANVAHRLFNKINPKQNMAENTMLKGPERQYFQKCVKQEVVEPIQSLLDEKVKMHKQSKQKRSSALSFKDSGKHASKYHFASVFDSEYFFSYDNFPFEMAHCQQFDFTNPFERKSFVNYQIWSEDEFEELIQGEDATTDGDSVQDDNFDWEDSLYSGFIERRDSEPTYPIAAKCQGRPWTMESPNQGTKVFKSIQQPFQIFTQSSTPILESFSLLCLQQKLPIPGVQIELNIQKSQFLTKLIHNKTIQEINHDWRSIYNHEKNDLRLSYEDVKNFIKQNTSKVRGEQNEFGKRPFIYKVKPKQNWRMNEKMEVYPQQSKFDSRTQVAQLSFQKAKDTMQHQKQFAYFNEETKLEADDELDEKDLQNSWQVPKKIRTTRNSKARSQVVENSTRENEEDHKKQRQCQSQSTNFSNTVTSRTLRERKKKVCYFESAEKKVPSKKLKQVLELNQ